MISPRFSEKDGCLDEHHDGSSTACTIDYGRIALWHAGTVSPQVHEIATPCQQTLVLLVPHHAGSHCSIQS